MEVKNKRKIKYLILGFLFCLFVFYCILSPLSFLFIIGMNEWFPIDFFRENYGVELPNILPGLIGVVLAVLLSLFIFNLGIKFLYKRFHRI